MNELKANKTIVQNKLFKKSTIEQHAQSHGIFVKIKYEYVCNAHADKCMTVPQLSSRQMLNVNRLCLDGRIWSVFNLLFVFFCVF